jgi:hypothetical protein
MSLLFLLGKYMVNNVVNKAMHNEHISTTEIRGGIEGLDLVGDQDGVTEPQDVIDYVSESVSPVVDFIGGLFS